MLLATRALPGVALSLPVFLIFGRTGLIDTHLVTILVYVAMNVPFTIWLIDGFFCQVPKELAEATEIDGCTRWQAFWKVEFPVARAIAIAGIFAFLTSWNEYALASRLTRWVLPTYDGARERRLLAEDREEIAGGNHKAVVEAAEILALTPPLDRKPGALSGGQRQYVAMGRVIVRHPDVFLFDEPMSNLDAKLRTQMQIRSRSCTRRSARG